MWNKHVYNNVLTNFILLWKCSELVKDMVSLCEGERFNSYDLWILIRVGYIVTA
jgi:hypothetical protein